MNKTVFYTISLFLGLILFAFSILQAGIGSILNSIEFFPSYAIIIIFLANFAAAVIISSVRWKVIIESQNHCNIGLLKVIVAKLAGFTMNYITPSVFVGGEPVRVYMIKESANCSWEKSFASVIIDQAIYFFTLFLLMIAGFLFLADHFSLPRSITYGFWIIISIGAAVLYLFYSRIIVKSSDKEGFFMFLINTFGLSGIKCIRRREKSINRTERIIADFFRNKKIPLIKSFALAFFEVFAYLAVVCIILFYLSAPVSLFNSISIFAIVTLANFVPIPGSLGSMEASLTFIFNLLELGRSSGFIFSLIFRLVNIAVVVLGVFAIIYFEFKNISHKFSHAPKELANIHQFLIGMIYKKR